jgi:glycosyltransferase involved in cell wall biosynthesis
VQVVHHGLDLRNWPDRGAFSRPQRLQIVAVGRLTEKKGFSCLLDACVLLRERERDFLVDIIGPDGGLEQALREEIGLKGLYGLVNLTGGLPAPEVRNRMRTATILCCPSIESSTSSDGIPNVVLEAMALGTPVVATDAGGLPEVVIQDRTGRVVPQRDSRALADALVACWDEWEITQSYCRAARMVMEAEFEAESTARAFLAALDVPASSQRSHRSPSRAVDTSQPRSERSLS